MSGSISFEDVRAVAEGKILLRRDVSQDGLGGGGGELGGIVQIGRGERMGKILAVSVTAWVRRLKGSGRGVGERRGGSEREGWKGVDMVFVLDRGGWRSWGKGTRGSYKGRLWCCNVGRR